MSDKSDLSAQDLAEVERQLFREWWFKEYAGLVAKRQREQRKVEADNEADKDPA